MKSIFHDVFYCNFKEITYRWELGTKGKCSSRNVETKEM